MKSLQSELFESQVAIQDNAKLIGKYKNDKIKLKGHLKVTRQNNEVLRNMVDELKTKNEEIGGQLLESKVKIANGTNEIAFMKTKVEEFRNRTENSEKKVEELEALVEKLKTDKLELVFDLQNCNQTDADFIKAQQKIKKCNGDLDVLVEKSLRCHSENASNQKLIHELETNQTKLNLDLASLKSTDADLVISQLETKECNTALQAEKTETLNCKSIKETCEINLADEYQKNQNLQVQNSNLTKSSESLRKKIQESEMKSEKLEQKVRELKTDKLKLVSDLQNCNQTAADLIEAQQKIKECNGDLEVLAEKSLRCHSENASNQKLIHELETNQTKLNLDLASLRNTDADLVISQLKTKECNVALQAEKTETLNCKSAKETCEIELADEYQKKQNLEVQNSNLTEFAEVSSRKSQESEMKNEELEQIIRELKIDKLKVVSDLELMQLLFDTVNIKQVQNQLSSEKFLNRNFDANAWLVSTSGSLGDLQCFEMNEKLLKLTRILKERCVKHVSYLASERSKLSSKLSSGKDALIRRNVQLDMALCSKFSKEYFPLGFENLMPQSLKDLCGDLQGIILKN